MALPVLSQVMGYSRASSVAHVNLMAYRHNLGVVRRLAPHAHILASVKADGYGHGLLPIAQAALHGGAHGLGVASINEALTLRQAGITAPILVLFQPSLDHLDAVLEYDLALMIADVETAEVLGRHAQERETRAAVHCHVDTGMGRQGFGLGIARQAIPEIAAMPGIYLEGVATHFPTAETPDDPFTLAQIDAFQSLIKSLKLDGLQIPLVHAANSAAIVNYPQAAFDMVRPGIMTFGVWPSERLPETMPLRPVMRWETHITQLRQLDAGHGVSYGRTYIADTEIRTAVLPIGYGDGYRIGYSNRAHVLIRGVACPVRGRVCMDQTVVEVTHLPEVHTKDTVLLLGQNDEGVVRAEDLAQHAATIPYEVFTAIGNRVPRIYEDRETPLPDSL